MNSNVRFADIPVEPVLTTMTSKAPPFKAPPPAAAEKGKGKPAAAVDAVAIGVAQRAIESFAEHIAFIQPLHRRYCLDAGGRQSSTDYVMCRMPNKVVKIWVLGTKHPYIHRPAHTSTMSIEAMFQCFEERSVDPRNTVFLPVISSCQKDQTIWLDCTSFGHVNWAGHRGTHTNFVARLVAQESLLRRMFADFFNKLRAKSVDFLGDCRPLVVIPYCDGGEHRSGAAAAVMAYCLHQDSWAVDINIEYTNKAEWQMCGCRDCLLSPLERTGPHYHSALDMFRQLRKGRLGF
jgi:hypothetical protein